MKLIPYAELIGTTNYLSTCTRPDITTSHSKLSQYLHSPGPEHWKQAKHLIKYLKTIANLS